MVGIRIVCTDYTVRLGTAALTLRASTARHWPRLICRAGRTLADEEAAAVGAEHLDAALNATAEAVERPGGVDCPRTSQAAPWIVTTK